MVEFGGGVALALGLFSRLAGIALFGDMVMAMITVTWATGINSKTNPPGLPIEPCAGGPRACRCAPRFRTIQSRRTHRAAHVVFGLAGGSEHRVHCRALMEN